MVIILPQKLSKRSIDYLSGIAGISFYFLTIIFIILAIITCIIIWGINDRKPINFTLVFPFWFIEAYILFRPLFLILNKKKRKLNNYFKKDEEDDLTYESQSGENINKYRHLMSSASLSLRLPSLLTSFSPLTPASSDYMSGL